MSDFRHRAEPVVKRSRSIQRGQTLLLIAPRVQAIRWVSQSSSLAQIILVHVDSGPPRKLMLRNLSFLGMVRVENLLGLHS